MNWKNTFYILSPYFSRIIFVLFPTLDLLSGLFQTESFRELHISSMRSTYAAYLLFVELIITLKFSGVAQILKLNIIQHFPAKTARYLNFVTEWVILKCTWKPSPNACDLASRGWKWAYVTTCIICAQTAGVCGSAVWVVLIISLGFSRRWVVYFHIRTTWWSPEPCCTI
jgi:hypothetical protein